LETHELAKAYEPGQIESKWYDCWLARGYFTPEIDRAKKPFVIIMPPPNVTGELHVGHALTMTIEDVLIRWHRMRGEPSLWVPGTDHAGIAVQVLVEQDLAREGKTREQVGRDEFMRRAWERAQRSRQTIEQQHRLIGASCDWTRNTFTLDEGPSRAVRTAFYRLYKKGLIYRGERMVNWCPRCLTALSDLEVEHKESDGHLYYFRYPLADGGGYLTVATTRPETCFGDTAVAVSPNDPNHSRYIGRQVVLPVSGRVIPVIGDEAVDPEFGTGALKITPSHDPTDLEVSDRHGLPHLDVFNDDGTLNEHGGFCAGLDRMECRGKVVEYFETRGLLDRVEPYSHTIGHCSRCRTAIEPRISTQWFVDTRPLAKAALDVVRSGEIQIVPEHFTKVYYTWMEGIKDWCISRQLWWGHRIPVWYCLDCGHLTVSIETPANCEACESQRLEQDPDVLDTWFSSGLWPHSTLGWPDDTEDMAYFYPTSVMQTGYDILFFWVARMIMMGIEDTGKIPFHTVFLNGLVRDEHGQKMSKMRGNVVRPDDAISKYGVDALRFALTTGNSPGNDLSFGVSKLEAARNFVNKLWNATRFVQQATAQQVENPVADLTLVQLCIEDRWILSRLEKLVTDVTKLMDEFQLGEAERQIYDFLWSEFCDWYIEMSKLRLRQDGDTGHSPVPVLSHVLDASLRLLHPFMPFVTEELWQTLQGDSDEAPSSSIVVAPYPVPRGQGIDAEAERIVDATIEIVRALRNYRAERKMESGRQLEVALFASDILDDLRRMVPAIESLGKVRVTGVENRSSRHDSGDQTVIVLADADLAISGASAEDVERVRSQLLKEAEATRSRLKSIEGRLADEVFLSKAPAEVVQRQKDLAAGLADKLSRIEAELQDLD